MVVDGITFAQGATIRAIEAFVFFVYLILIFGLLLNLFYYFLWDYFFKLWVEGKLLNTLNHFPIVLGCILLVQSGGLVVKGGGRVGVGKELGEEDLIYNWVTSNMLTNSYIGVQVWLITSKHTEPDLN